ncbi:hypothetical protein ACWCRC_35380, partial [Streptomyces sp. NPDC001940]
MLPKRRCADTRSKALELSLDGIERRVAALETNTALDAATMMMPRVYPAKVRHAVRPARPQV